MEMDTVQLRFRHTSGDVGPYSFPLGHTILQVKEGVFSQWPRGVGQLLGGCHIMRSADLTAPSSAEGPLSKENPSSAADLRILCAGKFLDNAKILRGTASPLVPSCFLAAGQAADLVPFLVQIIAKRWEILNLALL